MNHQLEASRRIADDLGRGVEMVMAAFAKEEARALEAEANQEYRGHTIANMRKAFDLLADPDDWRAPIDAWIDHRAYGLAAAAVEFFTCTELQIIGGPQPLTGRILVHADGYRMGPAGP